MRVHKSDLTHAFAGSTAFWLPNVILHMVKGPDASFYHQGLLILLQIFTTLATLVAIFLFPGVHRSHRRIASWMLVGIWVLGPFWLSINATATGGGFATDTGWLRVIFAILLFPVMTPILSVYDGSIPSVLITTLLLGLVCLDFTTMLRRVRRPS